MELVELNEEEFKGFAYHHEQASFLQTIGWARLKHDTGWDYNLLGFKDNGNVVAACMMLSKSTPIKKKMFYAPHGFILDYKNFELLDNFVSEIKKYVKKNNGIFFKIDPYVMMVERDIDGKVIPGGIDNHDVYYHMKKLGFKEINGKVTEQTLQSKWLFRLPIDGRSYEEVFNEISSGTRRMIRKNEKFGVTIREGSLEDIEEFKKIMDHTSSRRKFLSRSKNYYESMYKYLNSEGICRLFFQELNLEKQIDITSKELEELETEYKNNIDQLNSGVCNINPKKFETRQKELKDRIDSTSKTLSEYKELLIKHGKVITLGAVIYMIHGDEVLSLVGGDYLEFMKYQPFYTMHDVMIKYACENKYKYYNFYGIGGNLVESDPLYGIYLMKKGFGGNVVELLGEFDYPVSKFFYFVYKVSYDVVHKLKRLKTLFHK